MGGGGRSGGGGGDGSPGTTCKTNTSPRSICRLINPIGDGHQGPAEESRADNDTPGPLETDRGMTSSNPSFLIRVWKGDARDLAAPSSAAGLKNMVLLD